MALINAQDTSMIQLLLEFCIPTEADKGFPGKKKGGGTNEGSSI